MELPLVIAFSLFPGYAFDLSSLQRPSGYTVDDRADHQFFLNVCGAVTGTKCVDSTGNFKGYLSMKIFHWWGGGGYDNLLFM